MGNTLKMTLKGLSSDPSFPKYGELSVEIINSIGQVWFYRPSGYQPQENHIKVTGGYINEIGVTEATLSATPTIYRTGDEPAIVTIGDKYNVSGILLRGGKAYTKDLKYLPYLDRIIMSSSESNKSFLEGDISDILYGNRQYTRLELGDFQNENQILFGDASPLSEQTGLTKVEFWRLPAHMSYFYNSPNIEKLYVKRLEGDVESVGGLLDTWVGKGRNSGTVEILNSTGTGVDTYQFSPSGWEKVEPQQ